MSHTLYIRSFTIRFPNVHVTKKNIFKFETKTFIKTNNRVENKQKGYFLTKTSDMAKLCEQDSILTL